MKTVRLLPLLAVAAICLFVLKSAGLLLGEGYVLSGSAPAEAQPEQAQSAPEPAARDGRQQAPAFEQAAEASKAPAAATAKTEAAASPEGDKKPASETPAARQANAVASPAPVEHPMARKPSSADVPVGAEKDLLVSLSERREQLEARARELDLRENLIKVAENRVESRIKELKAIEDRIDIRLTKRDKERDAEYEKLVALYTKMKPKDAARIFEQMDVSLLAGLISRMNARTVSPILAEMDPAVANRVTVAIASSNGATTAPLQSLPKINGRTPAEQANP